MDPFVAFRLADIIGGVQKLSGIPDLSVHPPLPDPKKHPPKNHPTTKGFYRTKKQ
jgi:hypothetical protein